MTQTPTDPAGKIGAAQLIDSNCSYEKRNFIALKAGEGFKVTDTEFSECVFENCRLYKINFINCTFENCRFENCDLASASFKYTSLRGVKFIETKLTGIQWDEANAPLNVSFVKCLLNYCGFINVDLRNTDLIECQLREADFTEANLTKANCSYSDFSGARFMNTNLVRANFTNAIGYAIHPYRNKLGKTRFSSPEVLALLDVFDIIIE